MDITLELNTSYHERQNEKSHHQERKAEASKFFKLKSKEEEEFSEEGQAHSSLLNKDFKLMNSEKERRIKEGFCGYCGGKHSLESFFKRPQNKLTQPSGKFPSQGTA
ncbi:hypothetical protein O181_091523 [Austropuccinia psidii MF-1]|uniref:Uncharacterized protein n=1 Tax=Austropuccinia psidii MF-1 TaxID=1389203 RepID=A0A9Q3P7L3_9BASI|nr:hypothetical protein [Austropuccinia psidii MF-1]